MKKVDRKARAGQGSDPVRTLRELREFMDSAVRLHAVWDPMLDQPTYPFCLSSFEEFILELDTWKEDVEAKFEEPGEPDLPPLAFEDPAVFKDWLLRLHYAIKHLFEAAEDATRPSGKRCFSRPIARRKLMVACKRFRELEVSAQRGLNEALAEGPSNDAA